MIEKTATTFWVKIYASGPIDVAEQIIRRECKKDGLCITIEPTKFIYTGGEEVGYVIGLINYPKFPTEQYKIWNRAVSLANFLIEGTYQDSILVMSPIETLWISHRGE